MARPVFVIPVSAFLFILFSCSKPTELVKTHFQIDTVGLAELRLQVDTSRTYVLGCFNPTLNTDSVLTALNAANLDVVRAFLPIDNMCADPCGPGFLVELAATDDRIFQFAFGKGLGRAACSERWIRLMKAG